MSCQYNLLFLFLCGFAALSVSTETCGKDLLEGTSCIFKLPGKNNVKSNDIKWSHTSSNTVVERKRGKIKSNKPDLTMDKDGSLRFLKVSLDNTGTYIYRVTTANGVEIDKGQVEIKVYAKVPKPTVKFSCKTDGNATLICDTGNSKDLTVSWYEDDKMIQNDKNSLLLSSTQVQENKLYSCEANNQKVRVKSESITVSCSGSITLIGFDFWTMVTILASGGALLLLICVFINCACGKAVGNPRSTNKMRKSSA